MLSPHVRAADLATCISCGLCLNDCPTYRVLDDEADSPRGRIQLIRGLVASAGRVGDRVAGHLEACLVCRACETVCPSGVPFGRIMEGAREVLRERERSSLLRRLGRAVGLGTIANGARLRRATTILDFYVRSGLQRLVRATHFLPRRLAAIEALAARAEGRPFDGPERADADVALFAGCIMRTAFGDTERATVALLESGGQRVTVPREQLCCGALHAHAGDGEEARRLARLNIDAFGGSALPIVVNAAGCGAHLKAYGELLADEPAWRDRARAFAARIREASQAVALAAVSAAAPRPLRVAYQDACHLAHGQRIRREPRALLAAVREVTIVPIADAERCCGSAGIYNLTHPEVAGVLQAQKVAAILAARPDVVVSANPGCIIQIAAGLRRVGSTVPVVHLMRFVADPSASLGASEA